MNKLEKKLVGILEELKANYGVIGVKAEFEAEGTRLEEGLHLKEVISSAGLSLTLKIGGCESLRDMYDARVIGVNKVVAPMIESSFALKKFTESFLKAFPEDEREDIKFAINLETQTAYNSAKEILSCEEASLIDAVVIGRNDLSYSMGLTRDGINTDEVMKAATEMSVLAKNCGFSVGIGGGVSAPSVKLFKEWMPNSLDYYETRKVMFDFKKASAVDFETGILKALHFEMLWLQNKRDFYQRIYLEDETRFKTLQSRYEKSMIERGIK
ncbi:MAG: citrate lyase beta subunit [Polynucleobacter sp.]|nr:citrate lyase beta subunit [Polynucleobacter sp.]